MNINDINNRIEELKTSISLLKAIKQEYIVQNKDDAIIRALDDGIEYTSLRLQTYQTANWVMVD